MRSRFSRWDGRQDPFGPDFDLGEILDEFSEDVLSGMSPDSVLQRLMRQGISGTTRGLDDLRKRLQRHRKEAAERLNIDGPLADLQDRLNEVLDIERQTLSSREGDDARMNETTLDLLPSEPVRALRELMEYRFVDPEAQSKFDELVSDLQKQVLDSYFSQMTGSMKGMTPDDLARVREMLRDLNQMIAARERGETYDFAGFMARYGDMFPENPRTLDELLELIARRMAAMSRLMASMSAEQRRQLAELADALLDDMDMALEMQMLGDEMRALMPQLPWDQAAGGFGEGSMGLSDAVDAIDEMTDLEDLDRALRGDYAGSSIEDIDEDRLRRVLGEEAVSDLRGLKQIEKALQEAGIVTRSHGRLELTARGIRRMGERALVKVFEGLQHDRSGGHEDPQTGGSAEPTGATRPWAFGETGDFSVQKTVFNSVLRSASRERGPVTLEVQDFELVEAESRTQTATALCLDLSFSMPLRGHWVPAKRMALALQSLIESKYPQDHLYLIGFSDYARRMDASELTATGNIERVYGTNMQHAFLLARRLLSAHPRSSKQVIMVTDGEPTAHLVDQGPGTAPHAVFSWPPTSETVHKTLAEAAKLRASGITLNIFMLEDEPGLNHFMDELARRTGGRVFQTAGEDIGNFVLRDFVRRRR